MVLYVGLCILYICFEKLFFFLRRHSWGVLDTLAPPRDCTRIIYPRQYMSCRVGVGGEGGGVFLNVVCSWRLS